MSTVLSLPGAFQQTFLVDQIDEAINFYTTAFGALVVHRSFDSSNAQLKIAGTTILLSQKSTETARSGARFETILETGDVEAVVNQVVLAGAQKVGELSIDSSGRIKGEVVDPFGFTWVFRSLWNKNVIEFCRACWLHPPHVPALCHEYGTWVDRAAKVLDGEEHDPFQICKTAVEKLDQFDAMLNNAQANYLLRHPNEFKSDGCLLPAIINEMHNLIGVLRSSEIAIYINPGLKGLFQLEYLLRNMERACYGFIAQLPGFETQPGMWIGKPLRDHRRHAAYTARQFLKRIMAGRRGKDSERELLSMELELKEKLGADWRNQNPSF